MATLFVHFTLLINKPEGENYDIYDKFYLFGCHDCNGYNVYISPFWVLNGIYFLYFVYITLFVIGAIKFKEIFWFKKEE